MIFPSSPREGAPSPLTLVTVQPAGSVGDQASASNWLAVWLVTWEKTTFLPGERERFLIEVAGAVSHANPEGEVARGGWRAAQDAAGRIEQEAGREGIGHDRPSIGQGAVAGEHGHVVAAADHADEQRANDQERRAIALASN